MRKLKKTIAILVSVVFVLSLSAGLTVSADNTTTSSTPKAIFVTFYGDAQTQRGFSWVTDNSGLSSLIKIGTNSNLTGVSPVSGAANSSTTTLINGDNSTTEYSHQLYVNGLIPGTKYYYQVGDTTSWSSTGSFTTEATNTKSFSFIDLTDTGVTSDYNSVYAPLLSQAFGSDPNAAFVMNNGDITNEGGNLSLWASYAAAKTSSQTQPLLSTTTFVPVSGDTDTYSTQDTASNIFTCTAGAAGTTTTFASGEKVLGSLTNAFTNHFELSLPATETNTTNGAYYSFDYGDAHIMVLNTNDFKLTGQTTSGTLNQSQVGNALQVGGTLATKTTDWLTNECATTTQKWKIVVLHRAVQSVGSHMADPDITALRAQLLPIMAEDSIDLVLEGHDLSFLRSQPTAEDYQGSVPPYPPAVTYNNTKDEPSALGASQITETYNGLSTTFEINAQGNSVYTYGPGISGTATSPLGTAPTAGMTGGTVYIEPGVSNGSASIFSLDYYDATNANATSLDNSPFYYASNNIFPDAILPSSLRTPPVDDSSTSTGKTLTAPTYSAVNISGDKLVVTTYQYNASGKPKVIDNHGLAKPDSQTDLINQISALPSIDNLSIKDAASVKSAYDVFNALDSVDQSAVTNSADLKNDASLMQQIDPSIFVTTSTSSTGSSKTSSTSSTGSSNISNPKTGANSSVYIFLILLLLGAGALSVLMLFKKKASSNN